MSDRFSLEDAEATAVASLEEPAGALEPDTPFRVLLLGDWSGRASRGGAEASSATHRPVLVDRDNFDQVLAKMNVALHLALAGEDAPRLPLRFNQLDDFHPDRIFEQVDIFDSLKNTRERLAHHSTFDDAAEEVRRWTRRTTPSQATAPTAPTGDDAHASPATSSSPTAPPMSGASLLDQMLSGDESATVAPASASSRSTSPDAAYWNSLLTDLVRPHLAPREDPDKDDLIASVDEATSRMMRTILHQPDFQALEARWRALYFLTSRLETGTDLKLYILDTTKEELAAELSSAQDLRATPFYKLLVEQSVGTQGSELWSLVAGDFTFDATRDDVAMLARVAKLARRAGAPFVAAASPRVIGADSLAATHDPDDWRSPNNTPAGLVWDALRQIPEARYIGLALPRFLLRLPYGAETEPAESFDFAEMPEGAPNAHEDFLWGNPAFACVYLLAQTFSENGWDMGDGFAQQIEGLPLYVGRDAHGDTRIQPCAEVLLTQRAAEIIIARGLMPLLSFKDTDSARLGMIQSIAEPRAGLAGRWQSANAD